MHSVGVFGVSQNGYAARHFKQATLAMLAGLACTTTTTFTSSARPFIAKRRQTSSLYILLEKG
jgi:hypothetical protein